MKKNLSQPLVAQQPEMYPRKLNAIINADLFAEVLFNHHGSKMKAHLQAMLYINWVQVFTVKCQHIISKRSWHFFFFFSFLEEKKIWVWSSPWKIYGSRMEEFCNLVYKMRDLGYIGILVLPLLLILRKSIEV